MSLGAYVAGVGVLGPGLANWTETAAVLSGARPYVAVKTVLQTPTLLPPAERRRTGRVVKLAMGIALEATEHAGVNPADLASVFSSSGGDGHNCHELCQALALPSREISPTRFANSVHNAAAGYWSIAVGARLESNVLCAFDASFGAGLLEALTQVTVDGQTLLLVAYDTEYPEPIHHVRPLPDAFGIALVLTPHREAGSMAHVRAALVGDAADSLPEPGLERLRQRVPAARGLPLLRQLALAQRGRTVIEYLDDSAIGVEVEPCT